MICYRLGQKETLYDHQIVDIIMVEYNIAHTKPRAHDASPWQVDKCCEIQHSSLFQKVIAAYG